VHRTDVERHLREQGCFLHHHGANHDVWLNPANMKEDLVAEAQGDQEGNGSRHLPKPRHSRAKELLNQT
jgi:hypothetical protein